MRYKVKVICWENNKEGMILRVPFHWIKRSKAKSFEPTKEARNILDQYASWENLDINKPVEQLPIY